MAKRQLGLKSGKSGGGYKRARLQGKNVAGQLKAIAYWTIGGGAGFKKKKGTLTSNESYAKKVNRKAMENRTKAGYRPKQRANYGGRTKQRIGGKKGALRKRYKNIINSKMNNAMKRSAVKASRTARAGR